MEGHIVIIFIQHITIFFRNVYRIHPSFRIIGLAEPPQITSSHNQWLNSELLPLFLYHHLEPLEKNEEAEIIFKMVRSHFLTIYLLTSWN